MDILHAKKKTRLLTISAVVVLAAVIALVGIRIREIRHVPSQTLLPWALDTAPVARGSVTWGFPVLGTVSTAGEITITAQSPGTVLKMGPREGVAVRKGDFLAQLDTRETEEMIAGFQARLEAAKADAQQQEDELAREESLFKEGGSSATALEGRRTASIAAQQNVSSLERQIAALDVRKQYGLILAPAEGVIAARLREPGDVCMPGQPIYRLTAAEGARVQVQLPQSVVEKIGPETLLEIYHGNDTQTVHLDRIYPSIDAHALGAAEADLTTPPFGLPSGARIAGRVILQKRDNALIVDRGALISGADTTKARLFKVIMRNDTTSLQEVPVTIDLVGKSGVAVIGNLSPNDRVVVAHESVLLKLHDGDPVQVRKEDVI